MVPRIGERILHALMFNQGPQECPGKELAIFIIQSVIVNYLHLTGVLTGNTQLSSIDIDTDYIPQMINPCSITFKHKQRN